MVEWSATTERFGPEQATAAQHLLADPSPPLDPLPSDIEFLTPATREGSNIVS